MKFSLYVQIKLRVYIKKEHMKAVSHVEAVTAKSGFVGEFDFFLVNILVAAFSLTSNQYEEALTSISIQLSFALFNDY